MDLLKTFTLFDRNVQKSKGHRTCDYFTLHLLHRMRLNFVDFSELFFCQNFRSTIQCGCVCAANKNCSAFQFNKKEQTCSIGSQEDLTFDFSPNSQIPIHLDTDCVVPDYGKLIFFIN